jgi:hypothetical protein
VRFWALTFSLFGWAFGYLWAVKNQPLTLAPLAHGMRKQSRVQA